MPSLTNCLDAIESQIDWTLFDEHLISGLIVEIGYTGCTTWQHNRDEPPRYQNRKQKRIAEFLVKDAVPSQMFDCIVTKSTSIKGAVEIMIEAFDMNLPVYLKPGCYY